MYHGPYLPPSSKRTAMWVRLRVLDSRGGSPAAVGLNALKGMRTFAYPRLVGNLKVYVPPVPASWLT